MGSIVGATYLIKSLRKPKKQRLMKCYQDRNDKLSYLGMPYYEYLKTPEWKAIRTKVLEKLPNCLLCGITASQVHHTNYTWETLLGTDLRSLAPLCQKCHEQIEMDGKIKRSLREANEILIMELKQSQNPTVKQWLLEFQKSSKKSERKDTNLQRKEQKQESINRENDRRKQERKKKRRECVQERLREKLREKLKPKSNIIIKENRRVDNNPPILELRENNKPPKKKPAIKFFPI